MGFHRPLEDKHHKRNKNMWYDVVAGLFWGFSVHLLQNKGNMLQQNDFTYPVVTCNSDMQDEPFLLPIWRGHEHSVEITWRRLSTWDAGKL